LYCNNYSVLITQVFEGEDERRVHHKAPSMKKDVKRGWEAGAQL
jgi:hypothetical protein